MIRVKTPANYLGVSFRHDTKVMHDHLGDVDGRPVYSKPYEQRVTTCRMVELHPDTNGEVEVGMAVAICDQRDQFERAFGRKLSFLRLMGLLRKEKVLSREERTLLWDALRHADPRMVTTPVAPAYLKVGNRPLEVKPAALTLSIH